MSISTTYFDEPPLLISSVNGSLVICWPRRIYCANANGCVVTAAPLENNATLAVFDQNISVLLNCSEIIVFDAS